MNALRSRLSQKIEGAEPERMNSAIEQAESELLLYLNREELPTAMDGKLVELAALIYRRDAAEHGGAKASSYSEGDVSQSITYLTDADYQTVGDVLLRSVAHWRRRVRC